MRLAGVLVYAGQLDYDLETTNGIVALDRYSEYDIKSDGLSNGCSVVVEGKLRLQMALRGPEYAQDSDELLVPGFLRPGEYRPARYVLSFPRIIK